MAIRTLLQRWIEVLAGVYFACCEAWGVRRAVIIACEGDHFTLRKVMPKANADPLSMQIDATDQDEVSALVPGNSIPGRIRRAVDDSQIIFELPSAEVVVRRISVPAQARDFLLGIVRNRIDRLSPWPVDQTAYGVDAAPNSEDPANLDVRVLITSRSAIDAVRDRLAPMVWQSTGWSLAKARQKRRLSPCGLVSPRCRRKTSIAPGGVSVRE